MIALPLVSALLLSTAGLAGGPDQPEAIDGECSYSASVRERANDTVLILCNSFATETQQGATAFVFGERSWDRSTRFSGTLAGSKLEVDHLTLRSGRTLEAEGSCEIFHRRDGAISVISCLVRAGTSFYAANFVPSRI